MLAQVDFLYPFASYQHSIIKQSQHWPISLINILPIGPIFCPRVLNISDCYFQCFHATNNHAPILKFIRFQRSTTLKKVNLRLTCPRLEKATLSYFPFDGTNIQLEWDNLTHLALYSMSIIDFFLILCKTPRLVFCEISSSSFTSYTRRGDDHICFYITEISMPVVQ